MFDVKHEGTRMLPMLPAFFVLCLALCCGHCIGKLLLPFTSLQGSGTRDGESWAEGLRERVAHWLRPSSSAMASVLRKYDSLSAAERLGTTPLFYLGGPSGNPYLQDDVQAGSPEQRTITYFMSSEDANDFVSEMSQANTQAVNEMRLCTTTFEKVFDKLRARKQSRKFGRFPLDVIFRIQPSSRQCDNAIKVLKSLGFRSKNALKNINIPMFSADGLALKRKSGETITPYYFAYEDLMDDWQKIRGSLGAVLAKKKKMPLEPTVRVVDFTQVMCLAQGLLPGLAPAKDVAAKLVSDLAGDDVLGSEELQQALITPGIIPPRREIAMLRRFYRNDVPVKNEYSRAKLLK